MLFTFKAHCLLLLIYSTWKSGKIHRKKFLNFFCGGVWGWGVDNDNKHTQSVVTPPPSPPPKAKNTK